MKLTPGLISTKTSSGETVLDPRTGNFWQFNATGALILDLVRSGLDTPAVAAKVAQAYRLPVEEAVRDTEAFVADVVRKGIIADGQG